jgi:misacylated tRNA(Ala) deacylase
MTEELFREDAYLKSCEATVTAVVETGICLDRTVFYCTGGGQPGDTGMLRAADGREIPIVDCVKDRETGAHVHVPAEDGARLDVGDRVTAEIDWDRRHRLMRMHTCLHLLCSLVPGAVTGGSVGDGKGRLDFDAPEGLDKERLAADLNRLIAEDRPVRFSWISDDELAAGPDLVRTMSVKPPGGQGRVRIIEVEGADLQPCGGTHVRSTGEIGNVRVGKIENKGRLNRRVNLVLDE